MTAMGQGSPVAVAVALCACLTPELATADGVTASTSARITLHIAPRVELRHSVTSDRQQLCLRQIPVRHYYLQITNGLSGGTTQLPGQGSSYCLPPSATEGAREVVIVAQ